MSDNTWPEGLKVYQWESSEVRPWGTMVFCPGQGDFASRYEDVLSPLIGAGIKVTCFDWPGHGLSSGRRGHVGNIESARAVLDGVCNKVTCSDPELPFGIGGHSMGALMALDFMRRRPEAEFCWLSSPLLIPENGQSEITLKLGKIFASIIPALTIDTGVRVADCIRGGDSEIKRKDADDFFNGMGHSRISIGWGSALIKLGAEVRMTGPSLLEGRSVVASQGTDDSVCPRHFFDEFFGVESTTDLNLVFLEGARHEPFSDDLSRDQITGMLTLAAANWRECFGKKSESKNRA